MEDFFKDLIVVELANVLAGPAAGMFFAELGAKVIKVENSLTNGDVTRSWKLSKEDPDSPTSAYFASVNWNKEFLRADLSLKEDKKKVYDLLKTADIVITNYKPGDDLKLGMDHESIKRINENIIYASITGFGDNVKRTAYDLVLQAETGFMFMNGNQVSGPVKMPVALIDILAAHQLKEGILVALLKKARTGKGSKVSVSLYDSAIASLANQASNWLMTGFDPQPMGSLHPNIAPYGEIFLSSDNKQIVLAVGSNKQFQALCRILESPEIQNDPRFINNIQRISNREALFNALAPLFTKMNSSIIIKKFLEHDIPGGIIKPLSQVFDDESAIKLINTEDFNGMVHKAVKTAIFRIQ